MCANIAAKVGCVAAIRAEMWAAIAWANRCMKSANIAVIDANMPLIVHDIALLELKSAIFVKSTISVWKVEYEL